MLVKHNYSSIYVLDYSHSFLQNITIGVKFEVNVTKWGNESCFCYFIFCGAINEKLDYLLKCEIKGFSFCNKMMTNYKIPQCLLFLHKHCLIGGKDISAKMENSLFHGGCRWLIERCAFRTRRIRNFNILAGWFSLWHLFFLCLIK